MSHLSSGEGDWRTNTAYAFALASVMGPATTVACFGLTFALLERGAILSPGPQFTLGYHVGAAVTVLIEFAALLIPMAAVSAFGLAVFALPVSSRLGERLVARWAVIGALLWGGVSGGFFWVIVSALFSDWLFDWPGLFLVGAAFGAPTGVWWWFFHRRVLIRRAAVQN